MRKNGALPASQDLALTTPSQIGNFRLTRTYLRIVDGLQIHPYKLGHASLARRSMEADSGALS